MAEPKLITGSSILQRVKAEALDYRELLSSKRVAIIVIEPRDGMDERRHLASVLSANEKERTFKDIGLGVDRVVLPSDITVVEFGDALERQVQSYATAGIIVQLPVYAPLRRALEMIPSELDIDGIRPGNDVFPICATAEAALRVIAPLQNNGNKLVIVGGKGFVGSAIAYGLRLREKQYAILDVGEDLREARTYDLVISVAGQPNLLDEQHLFGQKRVVDVGFMPLRIPTIEERLAVAGDVNRSAYRVVESITPVPRGMGPLSMAVLVERLLRNINQAQNPWVLDD